MSEIKVATRSQCKEYVLEKYQMLRFEASCSVSIVLISGMAEIFGTEIVCGTDLLLEAGQRGTIVTFHGCKIAVKDQGLADQEIPHVFINIHANLEAARKKAVETQSRGPRVLICGQESVGKSTLCRTLVNYATRKNAKPILVDVNVGLNQICIPTTMAAMAVTKPYDLYEGWGLEEDPLVFCFGHLDPAANLNLFREQVNLSTIGEFNMIIIIILEEDRTKFIALCIFAQVDTVLVIEDGFLTSFLQEDLPKEVTIIRLPKSSGVVTRSPEQWMRQRDLRVRAYFHGENPQRRLHPHQLTLSTSEVIGTEAIPDALLPHGAREEETWRTPIPVPINRDLKNRLLAVSQATEVDQIPEAPIYGFMVVLSVSEDRTSFNVLSPSPEPPPNSLLVCSICYVDPEGV
ncbi:unnamed protein product [Schistocephalus solidus]|uniref:Polyribonucleotide 5'-hydroxyl-kinase Clp1 n=1 Tax=Schistocephalus solidus TaxID=70667 RepID=A0A183SRV5_SCHSO|nr:unnamed protein product [Schistocephalus solidus]